MEDKSQTLIGILKTVPCGTRTTGSIGSLELDNNVRLDDSRHLRRVLPGTQVVPMGVSEKVFGVRESSTRRLVWARR